MVELINCFEFQSMKVQEFIRTLINLTVEDFMQFYKRYNENECRKKHFNYILEEIFEARSRKYFPSALIKFCEETYDWKRFYFQITTLLNDIEKTQNRTVLANRACGRYNALKLKILIEVYNIFPSSTGANELASQGNLNMLQYIYEKCQVLPNADGFAEACSDGHTFVLDWLKTKGFEITDQIIKEQIETDNVKFLMWLGDIPQSIDTFQIACKNNSVNVCEFLERRGKTFDSDDANMAAEGGSEGILIWLAKRSIRPTAEGLERARDNGY